MMPVFLNAMSCVSALGEGLPSLRRAFEPQRPDSLLRTDRYTPGRTVHVGEFAGTLADLGGAHPRFRSRVNQLLLAAAGPIAGPAAQAIENHGPARVAVVLGVSTAGLPEGGEAARQWHQSATWPAGYHYAVQEMGNPARFLARITGAGGPCHAISTACSSAAKALASGARLLRAGLADAVIAGGADALCAFTIDGFCALESVSAAPCNPMSVNRRGINIGEGAALFLMTRNEAAVRLSGHGESSDGHHMTAPDPQGRGAERAMRLALLGAGVEANTIDYINLHGTATVQNDAMESHAVSRVLGPGVAASSTKPLTGHALAGAGAIEAAMAWATLVDNPGGHLPVHWWDGEHDPALAQLNLVGAGQHLGRPARHVMSNSFAFGGSNACLVLSAS